MGLRWASVNGDEADMDAAPDEDLDGEGEPKELGESWLLGGDGADDDATLRRAGVLTVASVLAAADDGQIPVTAAAGMLAGAGGAQQEAEAVERALCAAEHRSTARSGVGAGAPGALVTAGKACAAALRTLLDAMGTDGAVA
eukprot:1397450-Pleurochrysis_carterae.AAC.1